MMIIAPHHQKRFPTILILLLISAAYALAYSNCFHNGFYQDDKFLIGERAPRMEGQPFSAHFQPLYAEGIHFRPVGSIVISFLYGYFHQNVVGYHLFNFFLFYLNAVLLFLFLKILTKNPGLSLTAMALFILHPINTVFVNSISTQIFTLLSIFLLISLILLGPGEKRRPWAFLYFLSSLVFFGLALLCHPGAVVLIPVVLSFLYFIRQKSFPAAVFLSAPYGMMAGLYYFLQTKMTMSHIHFLDNYRMLNLTPWNFAAAFWDLVWWYFSKLILPVDITFIMNINPVQGPVMLKVLLLALTIGVLAFLIVRTRKKGVWSFALLWFLSGFAVALPATAIYPFLGPCLEILWMIFPSMGFFLIIGLLFDQLTLRANLRPKILTVMIAIFILLAVKTRMDNRRWISQEIYDEYLSSLHPANIVAIRGLAYFYQLEGNDEKSLHYYQRIADLKTRYRPADVFSSIAWIYVNRDDFENAAFNIFRAIQSDDPCRDCAQSRESDYERMIDIFFFERLSWDMEQKLLESLKRHPQTDAALINLGYYYAVNRRGEDAVRLFEQALALASETITRKIILSKLTALYYQLRLYDSSSNAAREILRDDDRYKTIEMLRNAFARIGIHPDSPDVNLFMSRILPPM